MRVSADGEGVVSHAGAELLRELAGFSGLVQAWDRALIGTYAAMPIHFPGNVLTDLAVAIADGADSISDLRALRDEPTLFGPVASTPTAWRVLDRVGQSELDALRAGRATARAAAWAAGAAPDLDTELTIDLDASIVIAHSDKEGAAGTFKSTYGFHPLLCFLDRPEISSGEALSGIVRPGNAGSNTATDHIEVFSLAIANLPEEARPRPDDASAPQLLVRADAAGATHRFAKVVAASGAAFSFGFSIDQQVKGAIIPLDDNDWLPAIEENGEVRDGAWVAELTELLDLSAWPVGSRVIARRENPHPGAQLSLFDTDEGYRHTAFICAARPVDGRDPRSIATLELRHRNHARIEDRIRQAKAAGLRRLPCKEMAENHAWLECVLAAADLVCWSKLLCFKDVQELARCEIANYRYRILHIAARLSHSGRMVYLRLDRTWNWAKQLALGFERLRAAFA